MRPELKTPPDEPYLLTIRIDGSVSYQRLKSPPPDDIHILIHNAVGGLIEMVPLFTRLGEASCWAFCNEEGKLNHLPVNHLANMLWVDCLGYVPDNDILVGDIAIVVGDNAFLGEL